MQINNYLPQEKDIVLIEIRDQLYDGSWDKMKQDAEARARARPFFYRLVDPYQEDIKRMSKLQEIEQTTGINLADLLDEIKAEVEKK